MLKKSIKKLIALTLATVTVATGSTAVSASTLTPKKSHSEAEITEYVDYFNEITDRYAFRPDGHTPVYTDGTHITSENSRHHIRAESGHEESSGYMEKGLLIRTNGLYLLG